MIRAERWARIVAKALHSNLATFVFMMVLTIAVFQLVVKAITGDWIPLP